MEDILVKANKIFEHYANEGFDIPIIGPFLWFIVYKMIYYCIITIWCLASFPVCLLYEILVISGKAKRVNEYSATIRLLMYISAFFVGLFLWSKIPIKYMQRHS